jgi:hypothetical protein
LWGKVGYIGGEHFQSIHLDHRWSRRSFLIVLDNRVPIIALVELIRQVSCRSIDKAQ